MRQNPSELIAAFRSSGQTQKDFCSRRSISVGTLQYHLRKMKPELPAAGPAGFIALTPETLRRSEEGTVVILRGRFSPSLLVELIRGLDN
jgi:hypothetical protein